MEQLQLFEGQFLVWQMDKLEQAELDRALDRFQNRFGGRTLVGIYCHKEQLDQLQEKLQLPNGLELKGRHNIQPNHLWLSR